MSSELPREAPRPGLDGSAYEPGGARWPEAYGIAGQPVPPRYVDQLVYPLVRTP